VHDAVEAREWQMQTEIVRFEPLPAADQVSPAADRLLAGSPQQEIRNVYADPSQQFFAGRWSSTAGCWRVRYTEHEFCHMLAGRIRIVADTGTVSEFSAGDSFVVPAGFAGTWEVIEPATKLYAIFEAAQSR
jgi:uncharacterized cupin superfamily protein